MNKLPLRRVFVLVLALATALALSACGSSQPAAKQAAPAAPAASAKLVVLDSVVLGSANLPDAEKPAKSCTLNNKFQKNEQIVWRAKVVDPVTGKNMGTDEMSKVQVKLGDGKVLDAKFGPHPKDPPGDAFWTASFTVPENYPVGTLKYSIEAASKDGRSGQFVTFDIATSALQILPTVRTVIPAKK